MIYIGILIVLLIILFDFVINRNIFSPVFMFSVLFLFIISLAMLRLNGIREFSNTAVYSIILGIIFFAIGNGLIALIYKAGTKKKKESNFLVKDRNRILEVRWSFINVLTFLVGSGIILVFFYVITLLIGGMDYTQIRYSLLGYDESGLQIINPVLLMFLNYVSSPGLYALLPLAIYFFMSKERKKFYLTIFSLMILYVFATGGRIMLVYTAIQFLAIMAYNNIKIPTNVKRSLVIVIPAFFIGLLIISNIRSSRSIWEVFYAYFSGPVVLLSEWQKIADGLNIWSYGLSFIYPITYVANSISHMFGLEIELLSNVVSWQGAPQNIWMNVFPNMPMNAFVTVFYFFYQDLRFLGIVLFSTIYGAISGHFFYRAYKQKSTNHFIMYLLIIRSIVGSFIIWQLGSTTFFISILMLGMCLKRHTKRLQN